MQKAYQAFRAVAGRVLFVGFSIQILFGICWMIANFSGFQKFGESALYLEISKNLICDEYEGILYPVLILIARGIEDFILIPYRYILYLLQIAAAFGASYHLLRSVGVKGKFLPVWGSLAMLTFPMAMQCHLAVLPDSLLGSLLLLELSCAIRILLRERQLRSRQFVRVLLCWLLAAFLQPEYLYLGVVPIVILFVYGMVKGWRVGKKKILYNGLMLMAFVGMIVGVQNLTQIEGYYGRTHQSLNARLVSRCAWFYIGGDYDAWPEEVRANLTREQAMRVTYYADNMDLLFGRTLEEALGEERAEEIFGEVAEIAWQRYKRNIVHDTAWDVVGYTFSPLVLQRQFTGKAYDSYSGRNYDVMREKTPLLTTKYMNYGCWWFGAGLAVTVLCQLFGFGNALCRRWKKKESLKPWGAKLIGVITVGLTALGPVLRYSLRGAGMMDYKKTIAVGLLWIFWMVCSCAAGLSVQRGPEYKETT